VDYAEAINHYIIYHSLDVLDHSFTFDWRSNNNFFSVLSLAERKRDSYG
jgi:hypothetical protein